MHENFNKEMNNLKENLLKMASLVDAQVARATQTLETGDLEISKGIKAKDNEVDAYDNLINTQCENILAMFQPVATDLRFVMSALMINNQLERCGDIAVNIAQRVKKTKGFHNLISESKIVEMGRQARLMVKDAIDCFVNSNTEMACKVLSSDEVVDKLNKETFQFLITKMQADNSLIEPASHLIVLARHIERLADHATNIAEDLVFFVDAEFIAHKKELEKSCEPD